MKYKGKELKTGSDCYSAAMQMMGYASRDARCLAGAVTLFLVGAEWRDRMCIQRLQEIADTPSDFRRLDREDQDAVLEVVAQEKGIEYTLKHPSFRGGRGMFGVWTPKPVNRSSAMSFQKDRGK